MDELISRLEKATGPSFELDCAIFEAVLPAEWFESKVINWFNDGGRFSCNTEDGYRHLDCLKAPAYTGSVDAALTLVPEGMDLTITSLMFRPGRAVASLRTGSIINPETKEWMATAGAMPLAICIAALKARAE